MAAWRRCLVLVLFQMVLLEAAGPKQGVVTETGPHEDAATYIIVFKPGVGKDYARAVCAEAEAKAAGRFSGSCRHQFNSGLLGFSGNFTKADLEALQDAYGELIDYVELDAPVSITGAAAPEWAGSDMLPKPAHAEEDRDLRLRALEQQRFELRRAAVERKLPEQSDPAWNLDRIDQKSFKLDRKYCYETLGSYVHVYVLDTGIRATHEEFRGLPGSGVATRVQPGFSVFGDDDTSDCNGHGTHTAATIGGLSYGVAKNVTLVPVRAMDCNGDSTVSSMLAALEWISANHVPPAVLSMSVSGALSLAINEAVRRLVESSMITVVVAAGNGYSSACEVSPGSAPAAITVGASDQFDRRWARSNWGSCVDIHAPGVDVLSATNNSASGGLPKTGTSMACPHIAGVVALYLEQHPGASPTEVRSKLNSAAQSGVLRDDVEGYGTFEPEAYPQSLDVTSTPNRLVYALLPSQAAFSPGILRVNSSRGIFAVEFRLDSKPTHIVNVSITVPMASWSKTRLAGVAPRTFIIGPDTWDQPRLATLTPSGVADGDYHLTFLFMSQDPKFNNAIQTVKVQDSRPLTGESMDDPRYITGLPFLDLGDSSRFADTYALDSQRPVGSSAPDVCYFFKPNQTVDVDISTCGSSFDTKLFLLEQKQGRTNLQVFMVNDDDPRCSTNSRNSKITTQLLAGHGYFIIVDGFSSGWISAEGQYRLSITPRTEEPVESSPSDE